MDNEKAAYRWSPVALDCACSGPFSPAGSLTLHDPGMHAYGRMCFEKGWSSRVIAMVHGRMLPQHLRMQHDECSSAMSSTSLESDGVILNCEFASQPILSEGKGGAWAEAVGQWRRPTRASVRDTW